MSRRSEKNNWMEIIWGSKSGFKSHILNEKLGSEVEYFFLGIPTDESIQFPLNRHDAKKKSKEKLINEDSEHKPTPISIFSRRFTFFCSILSPQFKENEKVFSFRFLSTPSRVSCCDFFSIMKTRFDFFFTSRESFFFESKIFCLWIVRRGAIFSCATFLNRAHSNGRRLRWNRFHILSWVTRSQSQMFWGRKLITGRLTKK